MTDTTVSPEPHVKRKYVRRQNPQREEGIRTEEAAREPMRGKRVRVRKGSTDRLGLPDHIKETFDAQGTDLLWVTDSINGQPAPQLRAEYEINGWQPILGKDYPEVAALFMPKGWQGEINVGGLVLMERPIELTEEARREEYTAAKGQLGATVNKLTSGQLDGVTLDTQHPTARANTRLTREMLRGMPVTKD